MASPTTRSSATTCRSCSKRWGPPPPDGTIIGNGNSKKYHRPDCPGYRDMAERNRVFFKTVEEAENAGFKRAGNCPAEVIAIKPAPATAPIVSATAVTVTPQPTTTQSTSPVAATVSNGSPLAQDAQVKIQSSPAALKIIGNKNSKVFHQPGCSGYERVSEKNRVFFDSVADAEAAGYKRAGNCRAEAAVKITPVPLTGAATATPPSSVKPSTPVNANTTVNPTAVADNQPKVESSQALKIVGNKNSKIFHQPWCSGYDRVSEKNRVYFNTEAEAEAAGYRLAKNCSGTNLN